MGTRASHVGAEGRDGTRGTAPLVVVGTGAAAALSAEDVDELRRALERATSLSEEVRRLSSAVAQVADSIVITAPDGVIQYVNPGFERVSGYPASEAVGKTMSIVRSGRHDGAFFRSMWDEISSGGTWRGTIVNRRRDGTLYEIEAVISPIRDADGAISAYGEVARDVTHERELEAQLRQSQKMDAVGRLAGGIAHDFNNILTVIQSYASLLIESADAAARADLEQLQMAAGRAAGLTRQLLAFSRHQVMNPAVLDIGEVVRGIEPMFRRLISEEIRLLVEIAEEPVLALADDNQLEQVLMNLVVNARDALPRGGSITIRVRPVDVEAGFLAGHVGATPGRYAAIEVVDDGIGMDEETLSRIFEPFFTTKEVGSGTGLGMSTVYGIVKQSNGYVWIHSIPGAGTEVLIHLPWTDRSAASPRPGIEVAPSEPRAAKIETATIGGR